MGSKTNGAKSRCCLFKEPILNHEHTHSFTAILQNGFTLLTL